MEATKPVILVPVDFSDHSLRAVKASFMLAPRLKASIVLLHAYPALLSSIDIDSADSLAVGELQEEFPIANEQITAMSDRAMMRLSDRLRQEMANGELPPVSFSTRMSQGVPEDAIKEASKELKPLLIVMGTRGAGKKRMDTLGSVTAEIFDTSTYPVLALPGDDALTFAIPDSVAVISQSRADIGKALSFVETLFSGKKINVSIINLLSRSGEEIPSGTKALQDVAKPYPGYSMRYMNMGLRYLLSNFDKIQSQEHFEALVITTRHKNIFERIFNPGAAHRLLLKVDLPMLVIPCAR